MKSYFYGSTCESVREKDLVRKTQIKTVCNRKRLLETKRNCELVCVYVSVINKKVSEKEREKEKEKERKKKGEKERKREKQKESERQRERERKEREGKRERKT